uniref:Paramyosin n=1 Tax=Schistocephalus solidus TaxID=70667 RepID=A0A183TPQ9_SCHSO
LESTAKTDNRHLKRQITDLQDSLDTYVRKVGDLERRSSDLYAELDRAKASLTAARETATLLRERQTRANEDCSMMLGDDVQISDDESSSAYDGYSRTAVDNFNSNQTLERHRNRSQYGSYKQLPSLTREKKHQPRVEYFSTERKKPFSDANTTDSDLDAN